MKEPPPLPSADSLRRGEYDPEEYGKRYKRKWDRQHGGRGAQQTLIPPLDDIDFQRITIERVDSDDMASEWRFLLDNYHYIPHSSSSVKSYGRFLRYFANCEGTHLALIAFSGSFLSIEARDKWIGWTKDQRLQNNRHIAQNLVFCMLPTVEVKNLASCILSKVEQDVRRDWEERYGDRLVLLDTLVAKDYFDGTCYRASNWTLVGETKGYGMRQYRREVKGQGPANMDRTTFHHGIKKLVFVKPLVHNWRKTLKRTRAQDESRPETNGKGQVQSLASAPQSEQHNAEGVIVTSLVSSTTGTGLTGSVNGSAPSAPPCHRGHVHLMEIVELGLREVGSHDHRVLEQAVDGPRASLGHRWYRPSSGRGWVQPGALVRPSPANPFEV